MGQYGKAAVKATKLCCDGLASSPEEAWEMAVCEVTKSPSSQKKGCPRCAFLDLCEDGAVHGIQPCDYLQQKDEKHNKVYALTALRLLDESSSQYPSKKTLWQAVMQAVGKTKNENGQLDVVLSLWRENLIGAKRELDN